MKMQGSTPQHYTIADFLKWNDDNEIILNPKFQRGPVWPAPARTYLIDSIIRGYPIPKLLLRTQVDRESRRAVRDVVDGQQRLRAIIDFASNKLVLGRKAREYQGLRYRNLSEEEQDAFLAYKLTCEQLINASDEDVLEVFVRINSFAIPVNEPELRNARYENDFTDLVKSLVRDLTNMWELGVISNRDRVRMGDQSMVAEILGFFMHGVTDGGEARISRLYKETSEPGFDDSQLPAHEEVMEICETATQLLGDFQGEQIVKRPHFLMFLAAVMYARGKLIPGKLDFASAVDPDEIDLADYEKITDSIRSLNFALTIDNEDEIPSSLHSFRDARATTQRMRSRQARFEFFCLALAGQVTDVGLS